LAARAWTQHSVLLHVEAEVLVQLHAAAAVSLRPWAQPLALLHEENIPAIIPRLGSVCPEGKWKASLRIMRRR
jgi:hypothetical protein